MCRSPMAARRGQNTTFARAIKGEEQTQPFHLWGLCENLYSGDLYKKEKNTFERHLLRKELRVG